MSRLRPLLPLLLLAAASIAGEALWIRDPAISPDGTKIAFSYRGDLWVVPAEGGEARPVTSHVAHERAPAWSPDGLWLAFASDRHGNYDVFLVPAAGGPEERLTFHSAHDLPACFGADGLSVLFTSARQDAPEAALPSPGLSELWSAPVKGGTSGSTTSRRGSTGGSRTSAARTASPSGPPTGRASGT
jgi:Tol biopolymer transport system component